MAKESQLTLRVLAINATSRVFRSIASSAVGVTQSIAKWGTAAAGVAVGAFAMTANKLGKLSDVAQAAGASTEELTKLSGALDILGIKASSPEELASAFQRMTKTTGQVGVEGFHKVVEEISKLPTAQERATAAMQVFGRTGLQFMPVIEGAAQNGVDALKDVVAAMPGISQAAADSGDDAADAMTIMWNGIKSAFAEGVGAVANMIGSDFKGGVREAAMVAAAQLKYFAQVGFRYVGTFFKNFRQVAHETFGWFAKVIDNTMKAIGGLIVVGLEMAASKAKSVLEDISAGAAAIVAKLKGDKELEQQILHDRYLASKREEGERAKIWNEYKGLMSQLDWKYEGIMANIDTSDLAAQRDAAIEAAKKAGEAYSKAAVPLGATERAKIGALGGAGAAQRDINPEALLGGTYKAVTFALRAGYATAQEKIARGVEKIAGLVKGVKDAVEDSKLEVAAM